MSYILKKQMELTYIRFKCDALGFHYNIKSWDFRQIDWITAVQSDKYLCILSINHFDLDKRAACSEYWKKMKLFQR